MDLVLLGDNPGKPVFYKSSYMEKSLFIQNNKDGAHNHMLMW